MSCAKIVVPISGGKDSQAALILAMRDGREVVPVFNYTGWDHPCTYEHIRYMTQFFGLSVRITQYREAATMPELVRHLGRFPFGRGRFCTSRYKQVAFRRFLKSEEGQIEIWLGIRTDEGPARRKKYSEMVETELYRMDDLFPKEYPAYISSRCVYRLPLVNLTRDAVFQIIADAGMKYNPLYDQGFDRVGCFPCLIAGKKTQQMAFATEFGQQQWKIIQQLENDVGEKYKFQAETACALCNI